VLVTEDNRYAKAGLLVYRFVGTVRNDLVINNARVVVEPLSAKPEIGTVGPKAVATQSPG
jgi:hypothetical protein